MRKRLGVLTALAMVVAMLPTTATAAEDGCRTTHTPIYEIQGDGDESPLHDFPQVVVTTEGIVTVDKQTADELSGFFIQSIKGDGNGATSDGIFVNARDEWGPDVNVGDYVRVTGEVDEQFGMTQIEWVSEIVTCRSGLRAQATQITAEEFNADPERYEGMLVGYPGTLAVTDTFNLERFGEVWLTEGGVSETPTNQYGPGPDAVALATSNIANSVLLDDGRLSSNPVPVAHIHDNGTLRIGDTASGLGGAIFYSFGQYRLMTQDPVKFKPRNQRSGAPHVGGNIVIGSANVLNYWTTLGDRGAADAAEFAVQTDKLVSMLLALDADILALQEVENDPDHTPILTLLDALNAADAVGDWTWIGELDHYNEYVIRNEILYRSGSVAAIGPPVTIADPAFDAPGGSSFLGRPPVAQTFAAHHEVFTVMVNHLKSKSCSGSDGGNVDMGDGQSCFNEARTIQAAVILDFVDDLIASTGDPDVLVVGDMNSYLEEDPIHELESELKNLVTRFDRDPYSFNFFAMFAAPYIGRGLLDHAFATDSMNAQVTRAKVWHVNADEPRFLDWGDVTYAGPGPYRASDHDPVIIGINLRHKKRPKPVRTGLTSSDVTAVPIVG